MLFLFRGVAAMISGFEEDSRYQKREHCIFARHNLVM